MTTERLRAVSETLRHWIAPLLLLGVIAYGLGFGWLLVSETDERCSQEIIVHEGARYLHMRDGLIPLERSCVFDDGSTYEDVPVWVNPVFFTGVGGGVACAVIAVGTAIAARRRET